MPSKGMPPRSDKSEPVRDKSGPRPERDAGEDDDEAHNLTTQDRPSRPGRARSASPPRSTGPTSRPNAVVREGPEEALGLRLRAETADDLDQVRIG
jgi:hypothetical protein